MTTEDPEHPPQRKLGIGRLEAFSDGVFAIAITLLVLEIAVPTGAGHDLLDAILDEWPSYLAYVVSFATIGALWLGHHTITEYLERSDAGFIRLNLLLLMVVAFIPFPTRLLGDYVGELDAERVAVTFYGFTLLAASTLLSILWRYAVHERLVAPDATDEDVQVLTKRLTPGLAAYAAMIVLGLLVPIAAVIGYLGIALYFVFPLSLIRRHLFG